MIPAQFPSILTGKVDDRNIEFRDKLFGLTEKGLSQENSKYLMTIYQESKLPEIRSKVIRLLYNLTFPHLKAFFEAAYKRERDLDAKMLCLRGLAQFISEREIDKMLVKFNASLTKRALTTPYNYVEYSYLKGENALQYLVARYGYSSFNACLEQVDRQYNAMPPAFKEIFTTNEEGDVVELRSSKESTRLMDEFFARERQKLGGQ